MTEQSILVVGPSWVGDLVMAHSLLQVLAKVQQKHHSQPPMIDVLVPKWCLDLVKRMPEVRSGIELPFGHGVFELKQRIEFGRTLKSKNYNAAYVLPNSWKSAIIPWAAKIPNRTGWRGEFRYGLLNDCRILSKTQLPKMVQRFVALGANKAAQPPLSQDCPKPKLESTQDQQDNTFEALAIESTNHVIGLCPGAEFGPAKRWPPTHYAKVCEKLIEEDKHIWLMGSPKDASTCEEILSLIPEHLRGGCTNWAGRTTLEQAIDLLAVCEAVITNDSGLMHITAAVGTPLVAVYGPTSPDFTPPLSENSTILQQQLSCQPCHQRECPLEDPDQKQGCMKQISPEDVLMAMFKLLFQSYTHSE